MSWTKVTTSAVALALPLFGLAGLAQVNVNPKAITQDRAETVIMAVSINNCFLLNKKVPYKTVLESSVGAVGGLIYQDHGAMIEGVNGGKPLSQQELGNTVAFQVAAQTAGRCESFVPDEDKKRIKEIIDQSFKAMPSQKTTK